MTTEYLNNKAFELLITKFQNTKKLKSKYQMFLEDIQSTQHRTSKRGKYQKPQSWIEDEQTYENILIEFKDLQDQLAAAFYTLSQNIVGYAKFNLIDQDDAIQEGVLICFEKIDRFDASKGKAFNYLTTCLLNALRQLYRTSRNYNELKRKYLDFLHVQFDSQVPAAKVKSIYKRHNVNSD